MVSTIQEWVCYVSSVPIVMLFHAPLVSEFHCMVQLEPARKTSFGPGAVGITSAKAMLAKDADTASMESDMV